MGGSCLIRDDERGTLLFLTVMLLSILLILAGVGVDLARVWVAREQAQTAVDAAALAGASAAVRYVTVSVRPGHCETCCSDDGRCRCCCVSDPVTDRTGTEKYM
ncbi:MAG: Tad domain-containing protein, partial [Peptococcaceae bacterium]|nr:Tad domain-containing protein [Peptococcaceae bacterium]